MSCWHACIGRWRIRRRLEEPPLAYTTVGVHPKVAYIVQPRDLLPRLRTVAFAELGFSGLTRIDPWRPDGSQQGAPRPATVPDGATRRRRCRPASPAHASSAQRADRGVPGCLVRGFLLLRRARVGPCPGGTRHGDPSLSLLPGAAVAVVGPVVGERHVGQGGVALVGAVGGTYSYMPPPAPAMLSLMTTWASSRFWPPPAVPMPPSRPAAWLSAMTESEILDLGARIPRHHAVDPAPRRRGCCCRSPSSGGWSCTRRWRSRCPGCRAAPSPGRSGHRSCGCRRHRCPGWSTAGPWCASSGSSRCRRPRCRR